MNHIPRHADSTATAARAPVRSTACVQLHSGFQVDLLVPDLRGLTLTDIATGLSRLARFNGATRGPRIYSVAQHSILVADIVRKESGNIHLERAALLHDAHECLMGDIPTPVKIALGRHVVRELECRLQTALAERFGLRPSAFWHHMLQDADKIALATEARDLMARGPHPWPSDGYEPLPNIILSPWAESLAHVNFLRRADQLGLR